MDDLQKLVDTTEEAATLRERGDIVRFILNIRDTWERTPSFNYRTELTRIMNEIMEGKHK